MDLGDWIPITTLFYCISWRSCTVCCSPQTCHIPWHSRFLALASPCSSSSPWSAPTNCKHYGAESSNNNLDPPSAKATFRLRDRAKIPKTATTVPTLSPTTPQSSSNVSSLNMTNLVDWEVQYIPAYNYLHWTCMPMQASMGFRTNALWSLYKRDAFTLDIKAKAILRDKQIQLKWDTFQRWYEMAHSNDKLLSYSKSKYPLLLAYLDKMSRNRQTWILSSGLVFEHEF